MSYGIYTIQTNGASEFLVNMFLELAHLSLM